ncbi:MAG TPA: nitronate monooxygenase [Dinghuibacter sp.]|uniref:NAD(P)H-dependent flavin oxidoreductase n=1 Tax=Dinghuibacter sp. TaxID=2024697 RepID=UPI002B9CF9D3|nr:nitronate monooxygenase [Dinghuibacter sp.]HTJ13302.1 nitronate monooxygenase [Dinghuibacter sp.]
MWPNTRVTERLGIRYPIFQGPFGGNFSTVKLTAMVSNLGGVGGFGAYTNTPEEIAQIDAELKAATDKPYNLNLWVSDLDGTEARLTPELRAVFQPYFDEVGVGLPDKTFSFHSRFDNQVQVILDVRPPVFSFMFGIPSSSILEECRRRGIMTVGAATTLDEAIRLESAGVDAIIAAGFEAGGHRPSWLAPAEQSLTGTFVLVQQIRDKVRLPVIAAGGIATGRGVAAALTLGADAVQVGTAFLACEESGALDAHRNMLFSEKARHTMLTRAFSGRLGRGLRNRLGAETSHLPFPLQTQLIAPLRQAAIARQQWDLVLFWGGQIAPLLRHRKAAELMEALIQETSEAFTPA